MMFSNPWIPIPTTTERAREEVGFRMCRGISMNSCQTTRRRNGRKRRNERNGMYDGSNISIYQKMEWNTPPH